MYKISVPIMATTITENNKKDYLALFKNAGASRIFIALPDYAIPPTLGENIAFFKQNGFEVGVWLSTIGHGFVLSHTDDVTDLKFTAITNIEGEERPQANCPLDENFSDFIARLVADIAKLGPDIVMLDDDFRLSQHGKHLCCACKNHLNRISEILGENITREKIKPYILSEKANKYRDAWLKAQSDSLIEFSKHIRAEVDKETPDVTVCACMACAPWDADDLDVAEVARILAGNHQPILRLTGAPYWATQQRKYPLIAVFEIARMLASFVQNQGFDLMSEGDVYPRPRYTCPASYLELYDAVTRADGSYNGILKYMFDYVAGPDFETGYLKLHNDNASFYKKLAKMFPNGANAGVRIITNPHTMKNADLDISAPKIYSPVPQDGAMLGLCGIPTIYRGKGVCNSVFGENARAFNLEELGTGTIIDAVSAMILTERGIDVGLKSFNKLNTRNIAFLCTKNSEHKSLITNGNVRVLDAVLKDSAEPVLFSEEKNELVPFAYRYENANGERFLVFLFEGASIYDHDRGIAWSGLNKNYATQEILIDSIPWLAKQPLPAYCALNPEVYIMCEKDNDTMSVGVFNCFADPLTNPVIMLGEKYSRIECLNCEAMLDGNKVTITNKLHAFSAAVFRLYKDI